MYPVNTTDRVQFRDPPYDEDFLGFQVLSAQSKSKLGNFTTEYPCNGPSSVQKIPSSIQAQKSSLGEGLDTGKGLINQLGPTAKLD